ncbi:hypothetical protein ABGB14_20880 [Nonomuraea sp. B10E15]
MRRSFRFLLRPTARQAAALVACLEDHRHEPRPVVVGPGEKQGRERVRDHCSSSKR